MNATAVAELNSKLDQLIGKVNAIDGKVDRNSEQHEAMAERMVKVEEQVAATKDVVEVWAAAKTSVRFVKWALSLLAVIVGAWFAIWGRKV